VVPVTLVALAALASPLYTKSAPPKNLPCQQHTILTRAHTICWTFDDHPTPITPRFLAVLKQHQIRGTFFIPSYPLLHYQRCPCRPTRKHYKWIQAIIQARHSIGNHSISHANLCRTSTGRARREIFLSQQLFQKYFGIWPRFWRPPHAVLCPHVQRVVAQYRLITVMYHVGDWRKSPQQMWSLLRRRVLHNKPYSIVLIHPNLYKLRQFLRLIKSHP